PGGAFPAAQAKLVIQRHPSGGHVVQPYGDVIQRIDWEWWKNYGYNAVSSLQSLGTIATSIAVAAQATGWGWAGPALVAAVPGVIKLVWDKLFDGGDINYSEETKKKMGIKLMSLATDIVSMLLPVILTGAAVDPGAKTAAIGSVAAVIAAASWVVVATFTDNYDSWEKLIFTYVKEKIGAFRQGERAQLVPV
ncbi:MAG TPA: hypothetical protein VN228_16610, partial [Pyrinomonadaceae bacterium]|nr:hypothetical protein [Pyrinomonadaceae bacterium]